jgi:universal stress protein E
MLKRFKNILFVADREEGLDAALDRAVAVSRTNTARLTVMDVTPDAGFDDYLRRTYAVDLNARLREQRLESLEALTRPYTDAGVPVYTTVVTGTLFLEVIRAVQRNAHDLVMKVAQQATGLAHALFGGDDMHLRANARARCGSTARQARITTGGCWPRWTRSTTHPATCSD